MGDFFLKVIYVALLKLNLTTMKKSKIFLLCFFTAITILSCDKKAEATASESISDSSVEGDSLDLPINDTTMSSNKAGDSSTIEDVELKREVLVNSMQVPEVASDKEIVESLVGNSNDFKIQEASQKKLLLAYGIKDKSKLSDFTRDDMSSLKNSVQIIDGKTSAGISVPGFGGLKLEKNQKNLNVYYLEQKRVKLDGKDVLIGIGYSVHYLFKANKSGFDVENLPYIAAAVQLNHNKTQVYYTMQSYGIIGKDLAKFFKPTFNKMFDVEGFSLMQSNVDGIHKIITGEVPSTNTKFTPEIVDYVGSLTFQ